MAVFKTVGIGNSKPFVPEKICIKKSELFAFHKSAVRCKSAPEKIHKTWFQDLIFTTIELVFIHARSSLTANLTSLIGKTCTSQLFGYKSVNQGATI